MTDGKLTYSFGMTIEERHETNIQRWNVESLKEYVDTVIARHEELNDQKFLMTKEAVAKAEQSNDKRLESMNEFREQLRTQSETFLTKEIYNAEYKFMMSKIDSVTKLVYIGIGLISIIEIAIGFILALLLHK